MKSNAKSEFSSGLSKEQWVYPSLEGMFPGLWYELTINPKMTSLSQSWTQYRDIIQWFHKHVKPILFGTFVMIPEMSHKSTKVHFHGKIRWADYLALVNFYLHIHQLKDLCTFTIWEYAHFEAGKHGDYGDWMAYAYKQEFFTQAILNSDPLIYRGLEYEQCSSKASEGQAQTTVSEPGGYMQLDDMMRPVHTSKKSSNKLFKR